jgi:hypothetical protein
MSCGANRGHGDVCPQYLGMADMAKRVEVKVDVRVNVGVVVFGIAAVISAVAAMINPPI